MINVICVICIDFLHVDVLVKRPLWLFLHGTGGLKYRDYQLKPFDCSLCTSWWCGLAYVAISGAISLKSVALCLVMAYGNFTINDGLIIIRELWIKIKDRIV